MTALEELKKLYIEQGTPLNEEWEDGRPIYNKLPGINGGYDNEPSLWLTKYFDDNSIAALLQAESLHKEMLPGSCSEEWLDFLAGMLGFTGEYWDRKWSIQTKKSLLKEANNLIWRCKGSKACISYVLNAFGIQHVIQEGTSFIIGTGEMGDALGSIAFDFKVILPIEYYQSSTEKLAIKLIELYTPCWCTKAIVYDEGEYFRIINLIGSTSDLPFEYEILLIEQNTTII